MSSEGVESADHCAFTLNPDAYEFSFDDQYARLLEPADSSDSPDGAAGSEGSEEDNTVWRCRRKTNPGKEGCPFHHHLNDEQAPDEKTLARAFLAVVCDELGEDGWISEELNDREEGCVLEIVPRAEDPQDGTKRRRTQFLGARFGDLIMTYERIADSNRYPIDLRGASADRIDFSHADIPRSLFATGIQAGTFALNHTQVRGSVRVGHRRTDAETDGGVAVSTDAADIDGNVDITGTVPRNPDEAAEEIHDTDSGVSLADAAVDGWLRINSAPVGGDIGVRSVSVGRYVDMRDAVVRGELSARSADVHGHLNLQGAEVADAVDLDYASVAQNVVLSSMDIGGGLTCAVSEFGRRVILSGTAVGGPVDLNSTEVSAYIDLSDTRISEGVDIKGANVGQVATFENATIGGPIEFESADIRRGILLTAARIKGPITGEGLRTRATVNASNAQLEGGIECQFAEIGVTLNLSGARIKDDIDFRSADVGALILLGDTEIDGDVRLQHATTGAHISLEGAIINGSVTLQSALVDGALNLSAVQVTEGIDCQSCTVHEGFSLESSESGADINLNGIESSTNVNLEEVEVHGRLGLRRATVAGGVDLSSTRIEELVRLDSLETDSQLLLKDASIDANVFAEAANVGGELVVESATVDGAVSIASATIDGRVSFDAADVQGVINAETAVIADETSFDNVDVGSGIRGYGARIDGDLHLNAARIGRTIDLSEVEVTGFIDLRQASVTEDVNLEAISTEGSVSLAGATVGRHVGFRSATVHGRVILTSTVICGFVTGHSATIDSRVTFSSAWVGTEVNLANAVIGETYQGDAAEVGFADATVGRSVVLHAARVHGTIDLTAGDGDASTTVPAVNGVLDLSGMTGAVRLHERCLKHPGVSAVSARGATLSSVTLRRDRPGTPDSDERVVYGFEQATIGRFSPPLDSEAIPAGTDPAPFDRVWFVVTEFEGFQFSKHRDRFARSGWILHELAGDAHERLAAVAGEQFSAAESMARNWLQERVTAHDQATGVDIDAVEGIVAVSDAGYREAIEAARAVTDDTDTFLRGIGHHADIRSIRRDESPVPVGNDPEGPAPGDVLGYVLAEETFDRPTQLALRARALVASVSDVLEAAGEDAPPGAPVAPERVVETLLAWQESKSDRGTETRRAVGSQPNHEVTRAVATTLVEALDLSDAQARRLESAWVPVGWLWQELDPARGPESSNRSAIAECVRWYNDARSEASPSQPPAVEWGQRLLGRVIAATMQFEAAPEPASLDAREATYAMAKTAAADAGANGAASRFFFLEKHQARVQHRQGAREALAQRDGWLAGRFDEGEDGGDTRAADESTPLEGEPSGDGDAPDIARDAAGATPEELGSEPQVSRSDDTDRNPDDADTDVSYRGRRSGRATQSATSAPPSVTRYAVAWIGNSVLRYLTGYGERPQRPIAISGVVIGVFFLMYSIAFSLLAAPATLADGVNTFVGNLLPAAVLSLGSFVTLLPTTPLLSGETSPCGPAGAGSSPPVSCQGLQLLAELEGFLGVFLVAVFVFTLTRSVQR